MTRALTLLLLLAACGPAAAKEKPPELPKLGDFNSYVLDVVKTYPTDGTHDYYWPKSGGWSGNARTLYYDGKVLLKGDAKGRCYCCGLTFEVFLQAWEAWCKKVKRPYKIRDMTSKDVLAFKRDWFGSAEHRDTLHGAVTKRGLGVRIEKWEDAKAGDFVQLWRHSGSGHSVVFKQWKKKGKAIVGITYWSTQKSTKGIGERTELFGDDGSSVKRDEFWIVRIGDPKTKKP